MDFLAIVGGFVGIVTGAIAILAALYKAFGAVAELKMRINELHNEIEKQGLILNGTKERIEHVGSRLSTAIKDNSRAIVEIEGWLTKHTEFERRSLRE